MTRDRISGIEDEDEDENEDVQAIPVVGAFSDGGQPLTTKSTKEVKSDRMCDQRAAQGGAVTEAGERDKCCVIIPAYCEEKRIGQVVGRVRTYVAAVVVIDDGSPDNTRGAAEAAGAVVLVHAVNKGKGAALNTGVAYALERGFDVVITMDGDGQHDPDDIPAFLDASVRAGMPALVGDRMGDAANMPLVRRATNRFMSWLLSREMGQRVPDTQCGYRLYRREILPFVAAGSERFAAESETLLQIAAHGARIGAVPIRAVYRDEKSKINPVKDAIRFFSMLRRYRGRKRG